MKYKLWLFLLAVMAFLLPLVGSAHMKKSRDLDRVNIVEEINPPIVEEEPREIKVFPSHVSLASLSPLERKKRFIEIMLPLIERANKEVLKERAFLLKIIRTGCRDRKDKEKLDSLKKKYKADSLEELLLRVDAVPTSLVLAQAAVESGWGTSRFFYEANNAFGMYTFKNGAKCLKAKGSNACLKVYDNLYESVKDFIYNINVGWAYKDFREKRAAGASVFVLADALDKYSTLGNGYAEIVKKVIRTNNFTTFDSDYTYAGDSRK